MNRSNRLPLATSQNDIWIDQLAWPDSTHLNIGGCLELDRAVNYECLLEALTIMVEHHQALRLIPQADGSQTLLPAYTPPLLYNDFSRYAEPVKACKDWERQWIRQPFEFGDTPPWRFAALKAAEDKFFIVIQFHHSIMDGWGTSLVIQYWSEYYNQLRQNKTIKLSQAPSFLDYIDESNHFFNSKRYLSSLTFWCDQLKETNGQLFSPRFHANSDNTLPEAHTVTQPIPRTVYEQLQSIAQSVGASVFHIILAACAIYFSRTCNTRSPMIGVPSLNRGGNRYKNTLGMFVAVLPMVIEVDPNQDIVSLLKDIGLRLRQSYRHTRCPLSRIGQSLKQQNANPKQRLFDVILSYEKQNYESHFGAAQGIDSWQTFSGKARYPLGITVCEFHQSTDVHLILEASEEFFDATETRMLGLRLAHLLQQIAEKPEGSVAGLQLFDKDESPVGFNGAAAPSPSPTGKTPLHLIEHNVRTYPDAAALRWEDKTLSYRQMWCAVGQVAEILSQHGVTERQPVAIAMERGPESVIAMLAVQYVGSAYIPLDTNAPRARVATIVEDANIALLLTQPEHWEQYHELGLPVIDLDKQRLETENWPTLPLQVSLTAAAYLLFTSGSTGQPKGVIVDHHALLHRLQWLSQHWQINQRDCALQVTQLTFDPSLIEIFAPLINGASIAFPDPGRLRPESLPQYCQKYQVTMMAFVPSTLRRFLDALDQPLSLRVACCGGEVLPEELAHRFIHKTRASLYNVYGPTETTIFCTAYQCRPAHDESYLNLPLGLPLEGTHILILNDDGDIMPSGVTGRIFVAGEGLAEGYLNRPALNDTAYPLLHWKGEDLRCYDTGDRGWLDSNGFLHFAGRLDRQVKLRGYRIELQEIEFALLALKQVEHAAANLVSMASGQELCVWVSSPDTLSPDVLREQLRQRLPDYMLPAHYYVSCELPLTASGKIDYGRLPINFESPKKTHSRPPKDRQERQLLGIWQEILDKPDLTVTDNFFDNGGDSLTAISLLSKIDYIASQKVPLHQLLAHPTAASMAEFLDGQRGLPLLLVSLGQTTRSASLYICASGHGDVVRFKALARELKGVCDVHMLQPPSSEEPLSFETIANIYANRIISRQDQTLYLAGFSVGGIAALETCYRLEAQKRPVQQLFLIDTIWLPLPQWALSLWKWFSALASFGRKHAALPHRRSLAQAYQDEGLKTQIAAMNQHTPKGIKCNTLLIKTSANIWWQNMLFSKWRSVLGERLRELTIQGNHQEIFGPGTVKKLSKIIRRNVSHRYK